MNKGDLSQSQEFIHRFQAALAHLQEEYADLNKVMASLLLQMEEDGNETLLAKWNGLTGRFDRLFETRVKNKM